MRTARFTDGAAARAAGFSGRRTTEQRRKPREGVLARAVAPVVAEVLERRRMLTIGTPTLSGGVLSVSCDSANDQIYIYQRNGLIKFWDDVNDIKRENAAWDTDSVDSIYIDGYTGGDFIEAGVNGRVNPADLLTEPGNEPVGVPVEMYGGDGVDTLKGSDNADTIRGGNDGDTLEGRPGNDTMYGSDGGDFIYGEAGADVLYGGAGNDDFTGNGGADTMYGEAGNDTFHSIGDLAVDYLDGGADSDTATDRDTGGGGIFDNTVNIETL